MHSSDDAHKERVFTRNRKGELKRFGKVRSLVFHPKDAKLIGIIIKRPDALLMVKRKERFAAIDRIEQVEGGIAVEDGADSWDEAACKRLGVDLDECILWEYMPVRTESGRELGTIRSIFFDDAFNVDHIDISSSSLSRTLLGDSVIEVDKIIGYENGAIVVRDAVGEVEESGGVAAKAGEAWAKTKHAASEGAKKAGDAVNDGAFKAGEAIGDIRKKATEAIDEHAAKKQEEIARGEYTGVDKAANLFGQQLGKAAGMFKGFKEEFDKASHDQ